ncbi:hypothetical protein HK101_002522 [Irineochytrium annulatum]|nr:hypothetical protein HK101_002522 [Irineochytrium annulatum]
MTLFAVIALVASALVSTASASYQYSAYSLTQDCNATDVRYPATIADVSAIINEARAKDLSVKGLGAHHSSNDIICTDGIAVSLANFTYIKINANAKTVTVGAGTVLHFLLEALNAQNLDLVHYPQYGGITVGGAIGTGAHGSTIKHAATLSDQLIGLVFVDGLGKVRNVTDPTQLDAIRVHLGVIGVVIEAVFPVIPAYKVQLLTSPAPDTLLESGAINKMIPNFDYFYLYWWPHANSVTILNGTYLPATAAGTDHWTLISDIVGPAVPIIQGLTKTFEFLQDIHNATAYCQVADGGFYTQFTPSANAPYADDQRNYKNPATGFGKDMMNGHCTPGTCNWEIPGAPLRFVDTSIAIALSDLPAATTAMKKILAEYPACFAFDGIFIRFSKASKGYVSMGYGRDTAHIEIVTERRLDATKARAELDAISAIVQMLIQDFKGRPHWGKNARQVFQSAISYSVHPKLVEFGITSRASYDPFGLFGNEWTKRVWWGKSVARGTGCALEENCWCKSDAECGTEGLTCTTSKAGFNVCHKA